MRGAFRVEVALIGSVRHAAEGHAFLTIPNPNVRIWFPCGSFCTPQNSYCAFLGSPFSPRAPSAADTLAFLKRLSSLAAPFDRRGSLFRLGSQCRCRVVVVGGSSPAPTLPALCF